MQQVGVHPHGALHERRERHDLEQVARVDALGRVVAESHVDPRRPVVEQPGDPHAQLRVRHRVVRDMRARLAHQSDLGVGQPDAMGGHGLGTQQAALERDLGRAPPELLHRDLHLSDRFVQVDVDPGAEVLGERARITQEPDRGQREPLDAHPHLHAAVGRAVRRSEPGLVRCQGVEPVFVVGDDVRQDRADPDLGRRLGHRVDVPVHVVHGRDPATYRLRVAEQRPPVHGLRIDRPNHRIPELREVLRERHVVGPPPPERRVVMKIDEPGHHDPTAGVEHARARGHLRPHRRGRPDGGDPIALDRDGAVEEHLVVVVHRDDDGVVDQEHGMRPFRPAPPCDRARAGTPRSPRAAHAPGRSS